LTATAAERPRCLLTSAIRVDAPTKKRSRAPSDEARPAVTLRFEERYADGPLAGTAGAGVAGAAPSAGAPLAGSSFWQPQDGAVEEPQLEHESQLEHELQLEQQQQCWNHWHKLNPHPPQPPHALACDCKLPRDRQTAATTTIIRFIKARFMKSLSKTVQGKRHP
jgi:hypothetical protein